MVTDYSFDQDKFNEFLTDLSASVNEEPVHLFLDNCKVHHAIACKEKMKQLNITPVWNVAYRFEYNEACEKWWAQLKTHFRPKLL